MSENWIPTQEEEDDVKKLVLSLFNFINGLNFEKPLNSRILLTALQYLLATGYHANGEEYETYFDHMKLNSQHYKHLWHGKILRK